MIALRINNMCVLRHSRMFTREAVWEIQAWGEFAFTLGEENSGDETSLAL
jgi:hypothetical protein